jgi:phytoene synthase
MPSLDESYAFCRAVARRRAKNFYYSFVLLPRRQSDAMCALYAFMRYSDDLSDEPGASREAMERWRGALIEALAGKFDTYAAWPAFYDTIERYHIPHEYLFQMIAGVTSDLEPRALQTFDELYRYCYQVASVVGLCTIHILGFRSPEAPALAETCGVAFQLTNILRDICEDAARGRVYLPAEDLRQFGVDPNGLCRQPPDGAFLRLMEFEAARARQYYQESKPLIGLVEPRGRPALRALIGIYSRLLTRIEQRHFDVYTQRVSLSVPEKCWIVLRSWLNN